LIRVWQIPFSTHCERVALAAGLKAIEVGWVDVDAYDRSPVLEVSGQAGVPVAEIDGEIVVDSLAILRRLEQISPEPPLWPSGEREHAQVELFLEWFRRAWMHALGTIYLELEKAGAIFAEPGNTALDDAKVERAGKRLAAHLDLFESLLAGSDYLVGDSLTVADIAAFPFLKYATDRTPGDDYPIHEALRRFQPIEGHPRLAAWLERIDSLPRA